MKKINLKEISIKKDCACDSSRNSRNNYNNLSFRKNCFSARSFRRLSVDKNIKSSNNNSVNSLNGFSKKTCRICYCEEENEKNPLVQPCMCSGSLKYIHLKCLKQWINTRNLVEVENNNKCKIFLVKQVDCELCKMRFPDYVRHKGKLFEIIEFNTEFQNYLILESLNFDKHNKKYIYIISLDNIKKLQIGRGNNSDIFLNDMSVSRVHCFFIIENENIFLEDNNSKFGSLVLMQMPNIILAENVPLYMQVGRTFICCKVKNKFNFFCCNTLNEKERMNFYHKQNERQIDNLRIMTVKTEENEDNEEYEDEEICDFEEKEEKDETWEKMDNDVDEDIKINGMKDGKYSFCSKENNKNFENISLMRIINKRYKKKK